MSDMYDKVREKPEKKKKNGAVFIVLAVAVVIIIVLGVTIFLPLTKRNDFWELVSAVSSDITEGTQDGSITCTYDGRTFPVDTDTAYDIYKQLLYREDVKMKVFPPKPKEGIHMDFGNGSTLDIWPVVYKNKGFADFTGIGVLYTGKDGAKYSFETDHTGYAGFTVLLDKIKE